MRATPFILGILGGLAGVGVHAVLLVRFFSQSHGLFEVFLHLALGMALGLAAILIAALCRASAKTLAVFLSLLGVLGFFPRPLSWAPAGALLIAGGVLAFISLRSSSSRPATSVAPPSHTGSPMHWSEAARLGIPQQPSAVAYPTGKGGWSRAEIGGFAAATAAATAVVIALSVWTPWTAAGSADSVASTAATTTTAVAPSALTTTTAVSAVAEAPESTTTTSPGEPDFFDSYSDSEHGFSIAYPATWRNTDPEEVGQRVYGGRNQAAEQAWAEAYVAAAFADWSGPTYDGCYLDFIWVEVYDEVTTDLSEIPEIRADMKQTLEDWEFLYPEVKIVDKFRDIQVGTAAGFSVVWSVYLGARTLVMRECVLLSEGTLYFLQFAAAEDDWERYDPIYRDILQGMTFRGSSPVI